ncbi:TetR/AcrR family transcriptional regulator [Paenibacillus sp. FSL R5-0623]|uniref:TetR/AcrR family transcriptional regulator n=1 Tax=Paenibacillus sp. FSL R5-0623 TaxID=2921651 RepID=UPI0030DC13C9
MQNTKVDPRIIRTRKLLMDAFTKLTQKKGFKDITIKDITDEANINRATFYSHFQDKYDLIDAGITKEILDSIVKHWNHFNRLNKKTILNIFLTLTEFHTKNTEYITHNVERAWNPLIQ